MRQCLVPLFVALSVAQSEPLKVSVASNGFYRIRSVPLPSDLRASESLQFRIAGAAGTIEVQFLEEDGRAKFWRRVDLADARETTVTVPLRFMRRDGARNPRWDKIRHLAIYFRNPGEYVLDGFEFRTQPGLSAELGAEELARIAFPNAAVRSVQKPDLVLLTDCADLDLPGLEALLRRFIEQARRDFPFLGEPSAPPTLLVFNTKNDYEQFTPRFAKLLNAAAEPPRHNGYTLQGISTSYWEPEKGTFRPVYLHEFTHSWFERVAALPSGTGGWLQEGLASHYQLLFHPQENFAQIVREGLAKPNYRMPLPELCSGKRIPLNRYWQAATVVRMLLTVPKYRDQWPAILAGRPFTDWDTLAHDWLEFCRASYGADN